MPGADRVIVIGAGIGGLTTAIALRREGVKAEVFERREEPSRLLTGGGFMLWHNAMLALRRVGLDDSVAAAGERIRFHEFRSAAGRRLARWKIDPKADECGAPAIALRRADLNTILMQEAGEAVHLGARFTSFEQDADGVTAHFEDGSSVRGDVLIGADGLRSSVRGAMRRWHEAPPRHAGYTAWQAITRLPGEDLVPTGTFFNLWGRGLRFLYCRLNEHEVYWDAITSDRVRDRFDTMRYGKREALAEGYRDWPGPIPRIVESTAEDAILPIEIFDRPPGERWSDGRVTLVGDAAHPMTLNLSQGAGQAIESGITLGGLLASAPSPQAALRDYEERRRDRTADMVDTSWWIGSMGRPRGAVVCGLRNAFMRATFDTFAFRQSYSLMLDTGFEF
uniref:FAD-dependent urate hydroxylase n=1 Tax=Actinoallomurus sp. ID145698 TaxID=1820605 RepID=A0A1W5KQ05_9ACTN|nr:FAD-dependent urate hydroxylase [Actinoallomurus sp. ID145698]